MTTKSIEDKFNKLIKESPTDYSKDDLLLIKKGFFAGYGTAVNDHIDRSEMDYTESRGSQEGIEEELEAHYGRA